jgi:hypothetical protein
MSQQSKKAKTLVSTSSSHSNKALLNTKQNNTKTKKINKVHSKVPATSSFEKDITVMFMEMLMMVKLYHWKTHSHSQHKATDAFYSSLNEHMDTFIEVLMGKTGMRIDLMKHKTIKLMDLTNMDQFKAKLEEFKTYLSDLEKNTFIKSMPNTDLLNIRDEILGDVNQLLYLLSLE